MKVGIPLFGTRVAPRFDCAVRLLLVEVTEGAVTNRRIVEMAGLSPSDRIRGLTELRIDTLICGGIDAFSWHQLASQGIAVLAWVTGEAEDALACFLRKELEPGLMMGPGGRCCGRWRFRRGKGPWWDMGCGG